MHRITILSSISDAGKEGRANEDRLGYNDHAAFVVDGATGLGDRQFMADFGSDAAWFATFATERLAAGFTATTDRKSLLREISQEAAAAYRAVAGDQPRYAWPLASLSALHLAPQGLTYFGLGDSALYILHDSGESAFHIPIPGAYEWEQQQAAQHIARTGGIGASGIATSDPQTLETLRESRARQNTEHGSVWTFGMVPVAADHIIETKIDLKSEGATALLCSDGFADLVALYRLYTPETLIQRAITTGLPSLIAELRHYERDLDPDGLRYPRYKQCDDATAILLRIERV